MIDTNSYYNQQEKLHQDTETQPVEQPQVEAPEEVEQQQEEEVQQEPQESPQAKNFRALRESKERAERERDEVQRRMKELEDQFKRQQQVPPEEEDWGIKPDDIVEGKHFSKVSRKIKQLEDEIKQYKQQSSQSLERSRLTSQFNDFDQVVNRENLEALRDAEPEVYQMLNSSNDFYATGVSAYKMIKKLGIVSDGGDYMANKIALQKNAAKPKPLASVGNQGTKSPLGQANAFANGLTPDLQKQLLREMNDAIKNRN